MNPKLSLLIMVGMLVFSTGMVSAEECPWWNPMGWLSECGSIHYNNSIGYEFIDNGDVVHIWNNATISDYFFEKDSGIQLTNHYEDYWTKNIFCLGYYNNDEWNKIACADELTNFQKSIETDNETYVNATLWKDIEYGAYDLRLGVQYHLGLNDENLSITVYGKNIGIDIPFDLGFAWKITDWDIPSNESEDYMVINGSSYNINGIHDLTFKNMNESYFMGRDSTYDFGGEFLRVDWNENLNYAVKMFGDGVQENFYIALLINAGHFNAGDEKQATFKWIDALVEGTNIGFVTTAPTSNPSATAAGFDGRSGAIKVTAPAGATKVVEIGWYSSHNSGAGDFEVGIYDNDAVNTEPEDLLAGVSRNNPKGTTEGWKKATGLNIAITGGDIYWIAVNADATSSGTQMDYTFSGITGVNRNLIYNGAGAATLIANWGTSGSKNSNSAYAMYAVYEEGSSDTCTCPGLNEDWAINMTDHCIIEDDCDLGTGTLSFTDEGNCTIDATIDTSDMGQPPADSILWLKSNGVLNVA